VRFITANPFWKDARPVSDFARDVGDVISDAVGSLALA